MKNLNPLESLKVLTKLPAITLLVVAVFLLQMAGQTHPSIWAIYTEARFGWTAAEVGYSLAVVGILHAVSQGALTGPMVKKFGERNLVVWGTFAEIFAFAAFGAATQGWMIYVVLTISSLFWASNPALQSIISREVPPEEQGELQGALMSLASLTAIINPLVMTTIYSATSVPSGSIYIPGAPYYLGSFFILIAFLVILKWDRTHRAKS